MTPTVKDVLSDPGRLAELRNALSEGRAQYGTQTFDQHLADRVIAGQVSFEVAVSLATNSLDFELQLRGLRRHKLRPLDKPLIPFTKEALASRAAFDAAIDADELDGMADAFLLN